MLLHWMPIVRYPGIPGISLSLLHSPFIWVDNLSIKSIYIRRRKEGNENVEGIMTGKGPGGRERKEGKEREGWRGNLSNWRGVGKGKGREGKG